MLSTLKIIISKFGHLEGIDYSTSFGFIIGYESFDANGIIKENLNWSFLFVSLLKEQLTTNFRNAFCFSSQAINSNPKI